MQVHRRTEGESNCNDGSIGIELEGRACLNLRNAAA
jgi:N-acetyl-anhydromuramyl-L-alanine amidase AmpD